VAYSAGGNGLVADNGIGVRLWAVEQYTAPTVSLSGTDYAIRSLAFSPDSKTLVALGRWDSAARIWRADQSTSPVVARIAIAGNVAMAFSPSGTSILATGRSWAHSIRVDGTSLTPVASRPFPNPFPPRSNKFLRFLDSSGDRLQVAVTPTLDKVILKTLRFDTGDDPPIEGDPEKLLGDWRKRLALNIGDDGEIVPAN